MLGKIFGVITLLSVAFGLATGRIAEVANAVPDGAMRAVEVVISLCGMTCLWCGMMRVLSEAGVVRLLTRLLSPLMRLCFPRAWASGEGVEEICASIGANLLGIGNAATPLALRAMQQMQKHNPTPLYADTEQVAFAVLNTASVTLIPSTLLALRRASGSTRPFAVLLPVWITSLLCASAALLLSSLPRLWERCAKGRTVPSRSGDA